MGWPLGIVHVALPGSALPDAPIGTVWLREHFPQFFETIRCCH
jgi:hypothetical protein